MTVRSNTQSLLQSICEGESEIWDRTSVAGVEIERTEQQNAQLMALLKKLGGRVGIVTDKSVQLIFPNSWDAQEMARAIKQMGGQVDIGPKD